MIYIIYLYTMKTIEDLKANRNEIIDVIVTECGSENVKEVMTVLASYVGFNGYFGMTAAEFTKSVIKDSGIADKIIFRNGAKARVTLEEMQIETSKKLMKNI